MSAHVANPPLIPLAAAASQLGITPQRVQQLLSDRGREPKRRGRRVFLTPDDLALLQADPRKNGRKRKWGWPGQELPETTLDAAETSLRTLQMMLLTTSGRSDLLKATGGRIPLHSSRLGLPYAAQQFLADALDSKTLAFENRSLWVLAHLLGARELAERIRKAELRDDAAAKELQTLTQVSRLGPTVERPRDQASLLSSEEVPPSKGFLARDLSIHVLTRGGGIQPGQSILIYGKPGTYKTRMAMTLAVLGSLEAGLPTLYYTLEESPRPVARRLRETVRAWIRWVEQRHQKRTDVQDCEFDATESELDLRTVQLWIDEHLPIVAASEAPRSEPQAPHVRVHGLVGTWQELKADLHEALLGVPNACCVVIDSLGPLGAVERLELVEFVNGLTQDGRVVVLVAEEAEDPIQRLALDRARLVCDLVVRIGRRIPGGANQVSEQGLYSRFVEIEKSRQQPVFDGFHSVSLKPNGRIAFYPSIQCWEDETLDLLVDFSRQNDYLPGFAPAHCRVNLPVADPVCGLHGLDEYVAPHWGRGGSLALRGPSGTLKEVIGLHACAHAVTHGRAAVIVTLSSERPDLMLGSIQEYAYLRETLGGRVRPYAPEQVGEEAAIYIKQVNLSSDCADGLLWDLYRTIRNSYNTHGHPVGLVLFLHFSELIVLPGFVEIPIFALQLQRLLSRLRVAVVTANNSEARNHNIALGRHPDLLPTCDLRMELTREEQDGGPPLVRIKGKRKDLFVSWGDIPGEQLYLQVREAAESTDEEPRSLP